MSCGVFLSLVLSFPDTEQKARKMLFIFFRISAQLFLFEQSQAGFGLASRIL
jgi:hypothetical protein